MMTDCGYLCGLNNEKMRYDFSATPRYIFILQVEKFLTFAMVK